MLRCEGLQPPMSQMGPNEKPPLSALCQLWPAADKRSLDLPPLCADFVAKVLLRSSSKFILAAHAIFV